MAFPLSAMGIDRNCHDSILRLCVLLEAVMRCTLKQMFVHLFDLCLLNLTKIQNQKKISESHKKFSLVARLLILLLSCLKVFFFFFG